MLGKRFCVETKLCHEFNHQNYIVAFTQMIKNWTIELKIHVLWLYQVHFYVNSKNKSFGFFYLLDRKAQYDTFHYELNRLNYGTPTFIWKIM